MSHTIDKDKAGQLDALVDLAYVVLGTAHLQGFDFDEAFKRVHEANMKKEKSVASSNPNYKGRDPRFSVTKPEGWEAPDLSDLVEE